MTHKSSIEGIRDPRGPLVYGGTILDLETVRDAFHLRVLEALDLAARETFNPARNDAGATDADLPRLFRAIDEQVSILADRYGVILRETPP